MFKERHRKAMEILIRHATDHEFVPYKPGGDRGDFYIEISRFWWNVARIVGGMNPNKIIAKWEDAGFPRIIKN